MKVKQESPSYVSIKEGGDTMIMTNQESIVLIADLINLVIKQGDEK